MSFADWGSLLAVNPSSGFSCGESLVKTLSWKTVSKKLPAMVSLQQRVRRTE